MAPQPLFLERNREPVIAPGRARGTLKVARVTVHTYPGDDLAALAGGHPGAVLRGLHHVRGPARVVRTAPVLAPRAAGSPEPVLFDPVRFERFSHEPVRCDVVGSNLR
jgi:hypothetical protein